MQEPTRTSKFFPIPCAAGCRPVKLSDADVLAIALVYKAARLTTYDPFLLFIGKEYITPETGLLPDPLLMADSYQTYVAYCQRLDIQPWDRDQWFGECCSR